MLQVVGFLVLLFLCGLWNIFLLQKIVTVVGIGIKPIIPLQVARIRRPPIIRDDRVRRSGWEDKRNVYTYYEPLGMSVSKYSRHMIGLWLRNWYLVGYHPTILTSNDAKQHPKFKSYLAEFAKYPTVNAKDYENSCYKRWLAFAAIGGGTFMDYDILPVGNITFPNDYRSDELISYAELLPMITHAGPEGVIKQLDYMANFPMDQVGFHNGRRHISDMNMMSMNRSIYDQLLPMPLVEHYSHFAYSLYGKIVKEPLSREHWAAEITLLSRLNRRRISVMIPRGVDITGDLYDYGLGMSVERRDSLIKVLHEQPDQLSRILPNYPTQLANISITHSWPQDYTDGVDLVFVVFGPSILKDFEMSTVKSLADYSHDSNVIPLSIFDPIGCQFLLDYNLGYIARKDIHFTHSYSTDMKNDPIARIYSGRFHEMLADIKALEVQLTKV
jgi:hypothetical protein